MIGPEQLLLILADEAYRLSIGDNKKISIIADYLNKNQKNDILILQIGSLSLNICTNRHEFIQKYTHCTQIYPTRIAYILSERINNKLIYKFKDVASHHDFLRAKDVGYILRTFSNDVRQGEIFINHNNS